MNEKIKATYHDIIRTNAGIPLEQDELDLKQAEAKQEKEVISKTLKIQWNQELVTIELISHLNSEIVKLETEARQRACNYSVSQNHLEIISLLVRAEELRKLKNQYVA